MRNEGTAKKGKRNECCSVDCSVDYCCIYIEGKEEGRAVEVYLAQWGMPYSAGLHVKAARIRAK